MGNRDVHAGTEIERASHRRLGAALLRRRLARLIARIDTAISRAGDSFADSLSRGPLCTGCCAV